MFVAKGAREILVKKRQEAFVEEYIVGLVQEADKLGINENELIELIKQVKGRKKEWRGKWKEKIIVSTMEKCVRWTLFLFRYMKKNYELQGRNGAGKTSLLSMMASFRKQTSGIFTIDGEEPFENKRIMQNVMFVYNKDFKDDSSTVKAPSQIITEGRIVFPSSCTII